MKKHYKEEFCSWCHEKTKQIFVKDSFCRRALYLCINCKNFTVKCRLCNNMAKALPSNWESQKEGLTIFKKISKGWHNQLCEEHNGNIASFKHLDDKWDDLEEYKILFKREKKDIKRVGTIAAFSIGGVVIFAPISLAAAPSIAASLGSLGLLGPASTGTAISTLNGIALTNASLAAVGGGTMAAGTIFITAAGAALGGIQGAVVSNNYYGKIKDFSINKFNEGKKHAVIVIDGFLNQKKQDPHIWKPALREHFIDSSWYHVVWESKKLYDLGGFIAMGAGKKKLKKMAMSAAKKSSKKVASKINPISWTTFVADLASNPWHNAMVKSSMTGILLADLLSRVKRTEFTLIGHSLGARVIYYLLNTLSTRNSKSRLIRDVYLLGGAVAGDNKGWSNATKAVKGNINNCYSKKDLVLQCLYRPANAWLSNPIGLNEIKYNSKIINFDVSNVVSGHTTYIKNLNRIINLINNHNSKV